MLTDYFMARAAEASGLPVAQAVAPTRWPCSSPPSWPGNVRQLRNVLEWLLIMAPGDAAQPRSASTACRPS